MFHGRHNICGEFERRWERVENAFSESVIEFEVGHVVACVWQAQDFGCPVPTFRGRLCRPHEKEIGA